MARGDRRNVGLQSRAEVDNNMFTDPPLGLPSTVLHDEHGARGHRPLDRVGAAPRGVTSMSPNSAAFEVRRAHTFVDLAALARAKDELVRDAHPALASLRRSAERLL